MSNLKKSIGSTIFSDQLQKVLIRHTRIGYTLNVMRQSACLVINPITVDIFAGLPCYFIDELEGFHANYRLTKCLCNIL